MFVKAEYPYMTLPVGYICVYSGSFLSFIILSAILLLLTTGTFDVQNVDVMMKNNGEYEILCHFATGSRARGCRVVLINKQNGREDECSALRSDGNGEAVVIATLPEGEYTVLVYDDEDDELIGQQNPAYNTSVSLTSSNFQRIGKSLALLHYTW